MQIPQHLLTDEQVKAQLAFEGVYYDIRKFRVAQEACVWSLRYNRIVLDGDDGMFWSCPDYVAAALMSQGYTVNSLSQEKHWKDGYQWPGWRKK